jgi:hypothetical protein
MLSASRVFGFGVMAMGFSVLPLHAQGTPGAAGGPIGHNDTRVHPGFTMTSLIPVGAPANWPRVSGLDFLLNGDLVVSTWDGFGNAAGTSRPGRVFIFKNAQTGDSTQVTYTQFGASNMNEPLGLKVSNGEIYIIEKDSLVHLVDTDKNQVLDTKQKIAGGWTRYLSDNSGKDLSFAHGLVRLPAPDSRFVIGLATRWNEGSGAFNNGPTASTPEKGCMLGMSVGSSAIDTIACGIRSPDGVVIGPDDGIFVTDNHGHYVPASKMVHVKQGRFFNVRKTQPSPFENAPVTPPVLWLPHGNALANVSVSPTQPVFLRSGVFKGQMLAGDNNMGTLQRYFLEKVGGEFQGAVFRFSGGLRAAAHRIVEGPDSALYIGGIGATGSEWGGWAWTSGTLRQAGLQRMKETGAPFFDVLRVRSTGATTFEIDFTEPITGIETSNFPQAQQWNYTPVLAYGSGRGTTQTLTVQSVSLSTDKKTVTVTLPGLIQYNVIHLRWTGITAESGRPLMSDRMWYTLNAFGPGEAVAVRPALAQRLNLYGAKALPDGRISLGLAAEGVKSKVGIYDMRGNLLETVDTRRATGDVTSSRVYGPGMYVVTAVNGSQRVSHKVAVF